MATVKHELNFGFFMMDAGQFVEFVYSQLHDTNKELKEFTEVFVSNIYTDAHYFNFDADQVSINNIKILANQIITANQKMVNLPFGDYPLSEDENNRECFLSNLYHQSDVERELCQLIAIFYGHVCDRAVEVLKDEHGINDTAEFKNRITIERSEDPWILILNVDESVKEKATKDMVESKMVYDNHQIMDFNNLKNIFLDKDITVTKLFNLYIDIFDETIKFGVSQYSNIEFEDPIIKRPGEREINFEAELNILGGINISTPRSKSFIEHLKKYFTLITVKVSFSGFINTITRETNVAFDKIELMKSHMRNNSDGFITSGQVIAGIAEMKKVIENIDKASIKSFDVELWLDDKK